MSIPEPHSPYYAPEPYFSQFSPDDVPPTVSDAASAAAKGFDYEVAGNAAHSLVADDLPADTTYEEALSQVRAIYFGMLRMIDDQVERFVDYLSDAGLREDTLLVFISDHGDYVGEYGMMRKGAGLPESLIRVPMLAVGPEVKRTDSSSSASVSLVDLLPTFCEVADAELPRGIQGRSLRPLLTGEEYPAAEFDSVYAEAGYGGLHYTEEDDINTSMRRYAQSGTTRMVRKDDWKLVFDMVGEGHLYNLSADPAGLDDRYNDPDQTDRVRAMTEELLTWRSASTPPSTRQLVR